jgi:hypothetical protein
MRLAVATALLLAAPAAAQDGEDPLTIVIVDTPDVIEARAAIREELEGRGYIGDARGDGAVVFRHPDVWRPAVVVRPDGRVDVRRRGLAFTRPGGTWDPNAPATAYLGCLAPWNLVSCVNANGLVMGRRKYLQHETATVAAVHEEQVAYQDAIAASAIDRRLDEELDGIWRRGVGPDGEILGSPTARRAAIGALWASRAPGPWGDRARARITAFVQAVVQPSEAPFDADEIAAIEASAPEAGRFATAPRNAAGG